MRRSRGKTGSAGDGFVKENFSRDFLKKLIGGHKSFKSDDGRKIRSLCMFEMCGGARVDAKK